MGLLDCCCAPWRQVAPAPEDEAPTSSTESRTRATRNSELVENGMMLVELLSPAQQEELASAFRQFDVDGSGAMYAAQLPRSLIGPTRPHALKPAWVAVRVCVHSDSKEITAVLRQLGMFPNPEQVRAIMQALDVDGNGVIEWSEFSALMAHRWLGGQEGRMDIEHATAIFTTSSEMVDVNKLRSFLGGMGDNPLSAKELSDFVKLADPHGRGRVPLAEFLALPCWDPPNMDELRQMNSRRQAEYERLAASALEQ